MYTPYGHAQSPFSVWQQFQRPQRPMPQLAMPQVLQPMPQASQPPPPLDAAKPPFGPPHAPPAPWNPLSLASLASLPGYHAFGPLLASMPGLFGNNPPGFVPGSAPPGLFDNNPPGFVPGGADASSTTGYTGSSPQAQPGPTGLEPGAGGNADIWGQQPTQSAGWAPSAPDALNHSRFVMPALPDAASQMSPWAPTPAMTAPAPAPQSSDLFGGGDRNQMPLGVRKPFARGGLAVRAAGGGLLGKLASSGLFGLVGLAASSGASDDGSAGISAQLIADQKRRLQEAADKAAADSGTRPMKRGGLACKRGGM